jgi:hypothetical protein
MALLGDKPTRYLPYLAVLAMQGFRRDAIRNLKIFPTPPGLARATNATHEGAG